MKYLKYFENNPLGHRSDYISTDVEEFKELLDFIKNLPPNRSNIIKKWFYFEVIDVYIRISNKIIEGKNNTYLQIANLVEHNESPTPPHNTPKYSKSVEKFILYLITIYPYIYFENISENNDPVINNILEKLGFIKIEGQQDDYYLNLEFFRFQTLNNIRKNYPKVFNQLLQIYPNINTGADMGELGFQ